MKFEEYIQAGNVDFVSSEWILRAAQGNGRFLRKQEMPPEVGSRTTPLNLLELPRDGSRDDPRSFSRGSIL